MIPTVIAAITPISQDVWVPIRYPNAVFAEGGAFCLRMGTVLPGMSRAP